MSLLDRSNETVTVFAEVKDVDADGNNRTRASTTGVVTRAWIAPLTQSGTSARRAEVQDGGFGSEQVYSLRFPRSWKTPLGAQSQIEWDGQRWSVFGNVITNNGSARTRHSHYMLVRS